MEVKRKGRPIKMIPEPETDADIEYVRMYNQYMALKKAQANYYQRHKEKKKEARIQKQIETSGTTPKIGRPQKNKKIEETV
jgi:hypothetical protein